jgi:hypothetical protein
MLQRREIWHHEQMKGLLANIDELFSDELQRRNGSVRWRTIASMMARGAE